MHVIAVLPQVLARLQVLVGQHESSHLMPHTSDTHELETTCAAIAQRSKTVSPQSALSFRLFACRLALKLSEIEALENEAAMSTVCADVVSIGSLPEQFSTAVPSLHEVELDLHMLAERDGGGVALHGTLLLSRHISSNATRIGGRNIHVVSCESSLPCSRMRYRAVRPLLRFRRTCLFASHASAPACAVGARQGVLCKCSGTACTLRSARRIICCTCLRRCHRPSVAPRMLRRAW